MKKTAKEIRSLGAEAAKLGRPRSSCPCPSSDGTSSGIRFREYWYAGYDQMAAKLRKEI